MRTSVRMALKTVWVKIGEIKNKSERNYYKNIKPSASAEVLWTWNHIIVSYGVHVREESRKMSIADFPDRISIYDQNFPLNTF